MSYKTQLTFFEWAKQDTSTIAFSYVPIEDYEISEKFLKAACENLQAVKGTIKVHAVLSLKANSIWVRDTSCFAKIVLVSDFRKTHVAKVGENVC